MKKMIHSLFVVLGFLSLLVGMIGIILPILPTTPFILLSAALFAKGSARFHSWFTKTRVYKKYIEDAVKKKEMTKEAKCKVLIMISCFFLIGFLISPTWHAKVLIILIALFHYYYFLFRIKTLKKLENNCVESE